MTDEAVHDHRDRVALIHADTLKNKNELNPDVFDAPSAELKQRTGCPHQAGGQPALCRGGAGHLQLAADRPDLERMVVTVQWEIAERLTAGGHEGIRRLGGAGAERGGRDAGAPAAADGVLAAAAGGSAIVLIRPDAAKRAAGRRRAALPPFPARLYVHRRKNLRGAWSACRTADSARKRWTQTGGAGDRGDDAGRGAGPGAAFASVCGVRLGCLTSRTVRERRALPNGAARGV